MSTQNKSEYQGEDRRKFERIPFSFHVYFVPCGDNKEQLLHEGFTEYCFCNNISEDGIQLQFHNKPKLKNYIKMQLTLPKQTVHALGQIIWTQMDETEGIYIVGIKFIDMEDLDRKKIVDFIDKALKDIL